MKRIIALIIAVVLVVMALASCQSSDQPKDGSDRLQKAFDYVAAMYKDKPEETPSDYEVIATAMVEDEKFPIKWEVVVTEGNPEGVKVIPANDGKTVKIDVDEKTATEIVYTLKFTVEKDSNKKGAEYKHKVPAFKVLSYAEYVAAAKDDTVIVRGVVTGIISKSYGDSYNCIYLSDAEGGYYVYGMTDDPVETGVKLGDDVIVTGKRDTYSGTYEIVQASVEVVSSGHTVTPTDLTETFKAATSLKDESLASKQSALVTVKGVEISGQDTGSGYYKFKLGSLESYVRISGSVCPLNADETQEFIKQHTEHFGYLADITGVACVYDGAFYITPVDVGAIQYKGLPEKSDEEKVAIESELIKFPSTITEETKFNLPDNGSTYTDVEITWLVNGTKIDITENVLTISIPDQDEVVTVKATLVCGNATKELDFSINVIATELTYQQIVEAAYKLGAGEFLPGTVRLFGTITSIDTPYSEQYGNVTVTIVVAGMADYPIMCYRMKGELADKLEVGMDITVEGKIKNYVKGDASTIEFDAGCVVLGDIEVHDQSKVLTAAYALGAGEFLPGTAVLTGTIKTIDTAYSEQYGNITVTIVCPGYDDYPIMCYRLKGEDVSTLSEGDTITVMGKIKNYVKGETSTIEFDAGCVGCIGDYYNEAKILLEAYRLEGGAKMNREVTLSGKIISVDTPYSEQYKNVTVTIVVRGFTEYPIQCFRLTIDTEVFDGAALKVDDEIIVRGTIKNYVKGETSTIEFDAGCQLIGLLIAE